LLKELEDMKNEIRYVTPLKDKTYNCEFCGRKFNNTSNKSKHKKICKKRKPDIIKEIKKLAKDNAINITINYNAPVTQIETMNNIQLKSYDELKGHNSKFNMYDISNESFLKKGIKGDSYCAVEYIEEKYFNPNIPENNVIAMTETDLRAGRIRLHNNGDWIRKPQKMVMKDLAQETAEYISAVIADTDYCITILPRSEYRKLNEHYDNVMSNDNYIDKPKGLEILEHIKSAIINGTNKLKSIE
jgi:hypothetical protein